MLGFASRAVAALSLVVGISGPVGAVDDPSGSTPKPADLRALVVLDVSGSMARDGGHGTTLLDGARSALAELAYSLPATADMGLRVYGAQHAEGAKQVTCADTQLLVPVAPLVPATVVAAAAPLEPTGDTPIAYSLTQAAADFPNGTDERDVVILISDGEDNCSKRPPCKVVEELRASGTDVRVETVGMRLAPGSKAQQELACISRITGGNYYDAQNSDALSRALKAIAHQVRGRLGGGKAVRPGGDKAEALPIVPGAYRSRIRPGGELWYSFDGPPDVVPRVTATIRGRGRTAAPGAEGCVSWRAELRNQVGEGHVYVPYGNSAVFDGTGFATTGASTTQALLATTDGVDLAGTWFIRLVLGRDADGEPLECAEEMGGGPYAVRLQLSLDDPLADSDQPADVPSTSPTGTSTASPSPTVTADPGPDAAAKYDTPADPDGGSGGILGPVLIVVAIGGLGGLLFRIRQRRHRGW